MHWLTVTAMNVIRYRKRPTNEQIENLREFTTQGERSDAVAFAGRHDVLKHIASLIRFKRRNSTLNSISQVIQGAPGAGKTSLLNELERNNVGHHLSIVRLEGEDLSEPVRVAEEFVESASAKPANVAARASRSHRTTGDVGIVQHEQSWEARKASSLERISRGASVWRAIKPLLELTDDSVFLLLVDEAQRVIKSSGKEVNEIVTSLHAGGRATSGLRNLSVYAGLESTSDQLSAVGLSRQAKRAHQLSVLMHAEAMDAVEGFMCDEDMGSSDAISRVDRAMLARVFAVASEGWPRHLHHYITGLAVELVTDYDRETPTGIVHLDAILEHGHQARYEYCTDRLRSAGIREVGEALFALTREQPEANTFTSDAIEQFVSKHYVSEPNENVTNQIARAIHAGVLEPRDDIGSKHYGYLIPSFSTFMACNGEREPILMSLRSALQERLDAISQ